MTSRKPEDMHAWYADMLMAHIALFGEEGTRVRPEPDDRTERPADADQEGGDADAS